MSASTNPTLFLTRLELLALLAAINTTVPSGSVYRYDDLLSAYEKLKGIQITGGMVSVEPLVGDGTEVEPASVGIDVPAFVVGVDAEAVKLTRADIEAEIRSEFFYLASEGVQGNSEMGTRPALWTGLDMVTICSMVLKNGTKITGVNHGPVSHSEFSAEEGKRLAREDAIRQIWPLMGYSLRDRVVAANRSCVAFYGAGVTSEDIEAFRAMWLRMGAGIQTLGSVPDTAGVAAS